jgi:hypothetical protein
LPYNICDVFPFKFIDAILPAPDTLASATLLAVVANDTAPDTFAPATAFAVVANDYLLRLHNLLVRTRCRLLLRLLLPQK